MVGLVVAFVVAEAGEETQAEIEYLNEIRTHAAELSRSGSSLGQLFADLREVGRDEFTTVLGGLSSDLEAAEVFVAEEPPTEALVPVWSLYRQAITAWDKGVEDLETAVLRGADDPEDALAINMVADALAEIRAGDALFLDLKAEFERAEVPEPISPLLSVRLSPADGGLASLAVGYVNAARSSTNNLGLRPGLKVSTITTNPLWQLSVAGQAVVPATEEVVFSVVVTNSGNVASGIETLELSMTDGGGDPFRTNAEVPSLDPNGQTTVSFPAIAVVPDTLYEVSVGLVVVNPDADLTDNALTVQFTVNPA